MSMVCRDCGTVGESARVTRGSIWIELVLWLCLIVPGLIYSIWRLNTRHDACRACGSKSIVPLDTPIGSQIAAASGYVAPAAYRGSPKAEEFGRKLGRMFAKKQ